MKQTSKTSFQADWLALREPADHAARDADLLGRAAALVEPGGRVLDLGSGTGSTARAFAAGGCHDLQWRFVDNDPALLRLAKDRHPMATCVRGSVSDIDALPLDGVGLITASALLDLMTADWVSDLATRLAAAQIPFYAALSYDGVMRWDPERDEDDAITEAFNRHQKSDKGFGAALGPDAVPEAARAFTAKGFEVVLRESPWIIGPDQAALHDALLVGIGSAAAEAGESRASGWTAARRAMTGVSTGTIGHIDLLAVPPSARDGVAGHVGR